MARAVAPAKYKKGAALLKHMKAMVIKGVQGC